MTEPITVRRKRLLHRSRYRGCLEADLLIGRFAERYLEGFDSGKLDLYEALIEESDQDLLAWIFGRAVVPERHRHELFTLLQQFGAGQS